ncbi:MAG: SusC/RagA family TonB-linked outer membrane protein [Chitinophagaceae bacterium]
MRKILLLLIGVFVMCTQLLSQSRTISGRITDAQNMALPNVSVTVKGLNSGTVTNSDGLFSLSVPASATTLVFSSVGFTTQEVSIGNQNVINVSLKATSGSLQEVVVTSFGIRRDRKTLGYSTPTINAEELTQAKNTNISNALVGKVAGLRVSGSGGSFTGSSILIRGNTSVTGSSQPLYVVDGVPIDNSGGGTTLQNGASSTNRAVDINPEDIESMTILKGAAATSSYGSRAAGGVILIVTKKGRKNVKNSIEYNSSYNIVSVNRLPEYQNKYAQGVGGGYRNNVSTSWGPEIKGQTVTNFFGKQEQLQAFPHNVSDIFKNGYNFQNNVSFGGSSEKTTYRFSYGNTQETYVVRNNKLGRNNFTVNINSDVTKKLTVSSFINFNNTASRRTQQGNQLSNPVFRSYFMPRSYDLTNLPYYDSAGKQLYFGGEDNPYWSIDNVKYKDEVNRIFGNVGLRYNFTNWLNADLKVGTDFYSFFANGFDEIGSRGGGNTSPAGLGGVLEVRNNQRSLNSYLTLNATKKYGDIGLNLSLGNEMLENRTQTAQIIGRELTVRGFNQMSNAKTFAPSVGSSKRRIVGIFGDFVIDYKSWVSLNLKARNDFVSTLAINSNSVFYPAVALSIVPTEIFAGLKSDFINQIKIRANYGKVGNAPGPYNTSDYLAQANPGDGFGPNILFPFNNQLGFTISNAAGNPLLLPEFTTEKEIGADISLWNNRITIEANHYQRKLTEGLFSVPYSAASGVTSVFQNAGILNTKGNEVALGLVPIKTNSGFVWTINANYTQFKTKVEQLAPGVANIFLGGFTTPNVRLVAGEEYGQLFGTRYLRDAQGRMILNATGANAGLPLATSGVEKIGNPNPKYTMGISNTFAFKGFDFSVLFDIREGGDIYSRNLADLRRNGVAKETAEFDRFDKDGNVTRPYKFTGVDASGNAVNIPVTVEQYWGNSGKYVAAEGYIVSTSWVRLREANLTYRMPRSITDKTPFGNIDFGLFGRNLFLWTKEYKHLDPEQNALGISPAQGLEFNAQPATRTVGLTLRLTL